jgi:hypothetical protein
MSTYSPTEVYGRPGGHAGFLARNSALSMAASSVAIIALIWSAFALHALSSPLSAHKGTLLICGIGIALAAITFHVSRIAHAKAAIGANSEKRVAKVLSSLGANVLMNGTLIGAGGDADHILLGPPLIVIETKTGHGQVTYNDPPNAKAYVTAGRRQIPGNPVSQVNRQAAALGRITHEYATAVVCIVDMENNPFTVGHTTICALRDLPRVLQASSARLDPGRAKSLAQHLLALNATEQQRMNQQRSAHRPSNQPTRQFKNNPLKIS